MYGWVGRFSELVMVNSSWTENHIKALWNPQKLYLLYPPVDCERFKRHALGKRYFFFITLSVYLISEIFSHLKGTHLLYPLHNSDLRKTTFSKSNHSLN